MIKKNLFVLFVFYFFVIQLLVAGILRNEHNLLILWGINLLAMLLVSFFYRFFTKGGEQKSDTILVKEKVTIYESEPETIVITEEKKIESKTHAEATPAPISESNIEYIKTKINRTKQPPLTQWSELYRLLMFLLAVIGFWGVLYLFWDTFDFFAVIIGAIGMMLFLAVIFKAANLWRKSIFFSGYFLVFLLLTLAGIFGMIRGQNYQQTEQIKEEVSTFIDGIKGKNIENPDLLPPNDLNTSGFLFEETGEVLGLNLSGETLLSGEQSSGLIPIPNQTGAEMTGDLSKEAPEVLTPIINPTAEVTLLDAIKHLLATNTIPLSEAKNARFSFVAPSSPAYPYMKTALEKKMIGSTTNPETLISCDVYMVMKGLAEGRTVSRTADIKADYWNVATTKEVLKGCKKWTRLTVANL